MISEDGGWCGVALPFLRVSYAHRSAPFLIGRQAVEDSLLVAEPLTELPCIFPVYINHRVFLVALHDVVAIVGLVLP